ncbi:MAG: ImmA/IrrE family metallo-endopeptidase [Firmicutes bacterium]|nr:ImmA/IrrE family metallo-endopeptidase [Bacillota bacterium]
MQALTNLYNELQKENIVLENLNIANHKAATINIEKDFAVFVDYDKITTLDDEFNVVSHEYGHCATGTTHKVCSPYELISRHEYRANRHAIYKFLPFEKFKEAHYKGYDEFWEIAEYLDLPEKFVRLAYDIYAKEGKL